MTSREKRPVRFGEVWQASFDPDIGLEQGGTRPALIVPGEQFNRRPHGLCVVAPITGRVRDIPTHVPVRPSEGDVKTPSVIICDQLRTISLDRLQDQHGEIGPSTMTAVRPVLARVFAL